MLFHPFRKDLSGKATRAGRVFRACDAPTPLGRALGSRRSLSAWAGQGTIETGNVVTSRGDTPFGSRRARTMNGAASERRLGRGNSPPSPHPAHLSLFCRSLPSSGRRRCSSAITPVEKMITLNSLPMIIAFHSFRAIHHERLPDCRPSYARGFLGNPQKSKRSPGEERGARSSAPGSSKALPDPGRTGLLGSSATRPDVEGGCAAPSLRRRGLSRVATAGTRPDAAVAPQLVMLMGTSGGGRRTRRAAQRAEAQLALPSLRRCQRPRGRSPAVPRLRCCQPGAVSSSAADLAAAPAAPRLMRLLLPTGRHGDGSFWPVDTNLIDRSSLNGRCRLCPTPLRKEGRFPR